MHGRIGDPITVVACRGGSNPKRGPLRWQDAGGRIGGPLSRTKDVWKPSTLRDLRACDNVFGRVSRRFTRIPQLSGQWLQLAVAFRRRIRATFSRMKRGRPKGLPLALQLHTSASAEIERIVGRRNNTQQRADVKNASRRASPLNAALVQGPHLAIGSFLAWLRGQAPRPASPARELC